MRQFTVFLLKFLMIITAALQADLSVASVKHPLPLIIDTDCDLDDMMAITYLIKNPRVEVKAITTVGNGIAHWEQGPQNILNVLELLGHPTIPVPYGAKESLSPVGSYPKKWRKQADEVSGIKLPRSSNRPAKESSAQLIANIALNTEEKITLLCIGPLTNIALAFKKNPQIKEKIARIYIMGGAILSPGNVRGRPLGFKNRVAEYNIFLDAKAAEDVFNSGVPITLIPIDIIGHVPSVPFFEKLSSNRKTPAENFIYEILKPSIQNKKRIREFLWDPVAAALITNPDIGNYRELRLMINLKKGPEYARIFMNKKGVPIQVVTQVDTSALYHIFLMTLSRIPNLHIP